MEEALRRIDNWKIGQKLDLSGLKLTKVPILPDDVNELLLSSNYIEILPMLPDSLKILDISHNKIEYIEKLPSKLKKFICSDCYY